MRTRALRASRVYWETGRRVQTSHRRFRLSRRINVCVGQSRAWRAQPRRNSRPAKKAIRISSPAAADEDALPIRRKGCWRVYASSCQCRFVGSGEDCMSWSSFSFWRLLGEWLASRIDVAACSCSGSSFGSSSFRELFVFSCFPSMGKKSTMLDWISSDSQCPFQQSQAAVHRCSPSAGPLPLAPPMSHSAALPPAPSKAAPPMSHAAALQGCPEKAALVNHSAAQQGTLHGLMGLHPRHLWE